MTGAVSPSGELRRDPARRIPRATYRLQLHSGFTFQDACDLVPYLSRLGISDCYSSPMLKANPGSTHGYDICDHAELNPELGSGQDYRQLAAALRAHGMGQIADFVPNHMGIDPGTNRWWRDVLENGQCSPHARFFDIDWQPSKSELQGRILLPILGDQYGAVLERGELRVELAGGALVVRYFEHELPIDPRSSVVVLRHQLDPFSRELGEEDVQLREYLSIITALEHLPARTESEPERITERHREKEVARERLSRLVAEAPRLRRHLDECLAAFNGEPGNEHSFDRLHELLEAQPYRLAYWRTAGHEINYRRFFDVNGLAGLHMEDPEVFAATHSLILGLLHEGSISGLRLDHVDGLFDPAGYLERLREAATRPASASSAAPAAPYVVVEKILSAGEPLATGWPIDGTTGYDFLNDANGLFVDPRSLRAMLRVYRRFTGRRDAFAEVAYTSKKLIMSASMASELNVLAGALNRLSEQDRHTRDFTLTSLRDALEEVVACFPIYRTYVTPTSRTEGDRRHVETAVRLARWRNPTMEPSIFEFIRRLLLVEDGGPADSDERERRYDFAMKFQQYTAPVEAKGKEDTAFYRFNLLASLNEVGGDPDRFGRSCAEFHEANRRRPPHGLLASTTHDTKHGEDARARINVLSEMPEEWGRELSRWARINASCRTDVDGAPAPDRNDEYLFYQTLVGVWPQAPAGEAGATASTQHADASLVGRLVAYMLKAVREAKLHTSWTNQNQAYESAVIGFVERALQGRSAQRFLGAFLPFQRRVAVHGMVNSLAQVVLKLASPGVPDFYQGTELWDLSLVDPDNRRPVDYGVRGRMLEALEPLLPPRDETRASSRNEAPTGDRIAGVREMLSSFEDGRIKLFLIAAALRLRSRWPELFSQGSYLPLEKRGARSSHVIAFAREHGGECVIAVAPRLALRLTTPDHLLPVGTESWGETGLVLPDGLAARAYRNLLTGEVLAANPGLPVALALGCCPIAFLVAEPASGDTITLE